MNRKVQLAFGLAIVVLVAVGAVSYHSIVMSSESDRWVRRTHEVLENLQRLGSDTASIESGDRGFALTGEEPYIERIIKKHGGSVWVEAELDRGATFYFTLGGGEHSVPERTAAAAGGVR